MGRFDKFVSKETKQRSNIIRVNPYEFPDIAGKTIARINSFKKDETSSTAAIENFISKNDYEFFHFITDFETRKTLTNLDFEKDMEQLFNKMSTELEALPNIPDTQIVVAGGFSAGKSSFLNNITGADNLLPTGIEPVSMVSTYLTLSKNAQEEPIVSGLNQSKALVKLNKEILQSIKHNDDPNSVSIASALDKLFVQVHHDEYDGVCFIDTPGYDNSSDANDDNGIADSDMASDSFKDGNVLFWIIDSVPGVLKKSDINMIKKFVDVHEGKGKIAIILSKADENENEINKLVEGVADTIKNEKINGVVDILGYSCYKNKVYSSIAGNTSIGQLLQNVKTNHFSFVDNCKAELLKLFDDEIDGYKEYEAFCNEQYQAVVNRSKENTDYINDFEKEKEQLKDCLNDAILDSYDNILKKLEKACDKWGDMRSAWSDFYDEVQLWDATDHDCFDNTLTPILNRGAASYNIHNKIFNDFNWNYKTKEGRQEIYDYCIKTFDKLSEQYSRYSERDKDELNDNRKEYERTQQNRLKMQRFKKDFVAALNEDLRTFKSLSENLVNDASYQFPKYRNLAEYLKKPDDKEIPERQPNIFDFIENGDFLNFRLCFAKDGGVNNLEVRNDKKYSPLTYAVKCGNTEMVRFFIDHSADISACDGRGYNAYHTAAENHNAAMCELLLKNDESLSSSVSSNGKTGKQIAAETLVNIN